MQQFKQKPSAFCHLPFFDLPVHVSPAFSSDAGWIQSQVPFPSYKHSSGLFQLSLKIHSTNNNKNLKVIWKKKKKSKSTPSDLSYVFYHPSKFSLAITAHYPNRQPVCKPLFPTWAQMQNPVAVPYRRMTELNPNPVLCATLLPHQQPFQCIPGMDNLYVNKGVNVHLIHWVDIISIPLLGHLPPINQCKHFTAIIAFCTSSRC